MNLYIATPRGFCAGVVRAIDIVEMSLKKWGPPIYVRHEIVHNKFVVNRLKKKGVIFVSELNECPDDKPVIFSAHGVPKSVPEEAERTFGKGKAHDADESPVEVEEVPRMFAMKDGKISFTGEKE